MSQVNVHDATTHLAQLPARVEAGEEVVVARGGKPVARLVPVVPSLPRIVGGDEGLVEFADDFYAPLSLGG